MKKKLVAGVAALAVALAVFVVPSTAQAAARPAYVEISAWALRNYDADWAVDQMDRYIGSDLRRGKCRSGYKCVKIFGSDSIGRSSVAETWYWNTDRVQIRLGSKGLQYGWYIRHSVVMHEMAHAFGVNRHNTSCNYLMYYAVTCPSGRHVYRNLSASERSILSRG